MAAIKPSPSGVTLQVRVQPKASRNAWHVDDSGIVRVYLTAPPVDGEANKALISFVAKALGVPRGALTLIRGERSREKVLGIDGVSFSQVSNVLPGSQ